MVTSATFAAIPQRWITRIEWFRVLVRTGDLSFTTNQKRLKTVEYFLLEMILKNIFEIFRPRKSDFLSWYHHFQQQSTHLVNNLLYDFSRPTIFENIFQNHLQQKVLDGFQCFLMHSEAEIVSSHEHLESFNTSDPEGSESPQTAGSGLLQKRHYFLIIIKKQVYILKTCI